MQQGKTHFLLDTGGATDGMNSQKKQEQENSIQLVFYCGITWHKVEGILLELPQKGGKENLIYDKLLNKH